MKCMMLGVATTGRFPFLAGDPELNLNFTPGMLGNPAWPKKSGRGAWSRRQFDSLKFARLEFELKKCWKLAFHPFTKIQPTKQNCCGYCKPAILPFSNFSPNQILDPSRPRSCFNKKWSGKSLKVQNKPIIFWPTNFRDQMSKGNRKMMLG